MAQVEKKDRHAGYLEMRKRGDVIGELGDCSIIATALAADISYDKAREIYKGVGRLAHNGVSTLQIDRAMDTLNHVYDIKSKLFDSSDMAPLYEKIHAKTLTFNNVVKALDKDKKYVVVGIGHMVAFTDGRIADWSEGTKQHVESIYEILQ